MARIKTVVDWRTTSEPYLPYWSHASSGVVLLEDGSRLAMAKVSGVPHELCHASERQANAELLNRIWRDIQDDNITICIHFVRNLAPDNYELPKFRNEFSRKLYKAYHSHVICEKLYTNDWYLSLIVSPRGVPIGTKRFRRKIARHLYRLRQGNDRKFTDTSEIEGIWLQIERSLAKYSVKRLGYRINQTRHHTYRFSEIGEAMKLFLATPGAVPITTGRLADDIFTDSEQPIFERRIFRILPPGCDDDSDDAEGVKWGAIYGIQNYMEEGGPDLFDAVLSLDMPVVVSQYFSFTSTPTAVAHLVRTARQMEASKDAAVDQRKGLRKAASKTQSREEARGEHAVSVAVYADTYSQGLKNAATARAHLVSTGAQLAEETGSNMSAYFGQLPGNFEYCPHPGKMGSRDFANFANFGCYPSGSTDGPWGTAMVQFPTSAWTAYNFIPHVADVGMAAFFGKTGSGKSVLLCFLMAMVDQYMVDNDGIIIMVDKDDGCLIFVDAVGGSNIRIQYGESSGFAPLLGFKEDTPYARASLVRLFTACIISDGLGPIPPRDNYWLERGVSAMLRLPLSMRKISRMRLFLGWDDPMGAGPRLERWCRGNSLGWVFDNDRDFLNFDAPAVRLDFGAVLNDPLVLDLLMQYALDRINTAIDGRRAVLVADEAGRYKKQISDFYRTGRKKNLICWLATQQPEDFLVDDVGRGILAQCHTMGFFATPDASHRIYCGNAEEGGLGRTEGEYEAIKNGMTPGSHQFLLARTGLDAESVILNFDLGSLPPEFLRVLSGTSVRVKRWLDLRNRVPDALEAFAVAAD